MPGAVPGPGAWVPGVEGTVGAVVALGTVGVMPGPFSGAEPSGEDMVGSLPGT